LGDLAKPEFHELSVANTAARPTLNDEGAAPNATPCDYAAIRRPYAPFIRPLECRKSSLFRETAQAQ